MKRRNAKIEDMFTESQDREVNNLKKEGYALVAFYPGEHVIEMHKNTGNGHAMAYIKPTGEIERFPRRGTSR